MKIQKVCVLLSHVPTELKNLYLTSIGNYLERKYQRTNQEFKVEVYPYETDAQFYTEQGINTSGQPIVYVRPIEQGIESHKAEMALGVEFDSACLIYDPAFIIGPPPTNPVQNPVVIEGINFFQIPTTWFGNSDESIRLFFGHEKNHSDTFIVNFEKGLNLRDKTHDPAPPEYHQWGQPLEPPDFFISLFLELKPHWDALTQSAGSTPVMLAFKFGSTIYVQIFSKFVPIGDPDTFLELGGSWTYVKTLTQAEFDSIVKPYLAASTILA